MKKAIYFSTTTCMPCKTLKPIAQDVANETGVPLEFIDAQIRSDLSEAYGVTKVPTIILFKNNIPALRHTGMATKQQLKSLFTQI